MRKLVALIIVFVVSAMLHEAIKEHLPTYELVFNTVVSNPGETLLLLVSIYAAFLFYIAIWSAWAAIAGTPGRILDFIAKRALSAAAYEDKIEQAIVDLQFEPVRLRNEGQPFLAFKMAMRLYVGVWRGLGYHVMVVLFGLLTIGYIKG